MFNTHELELPLSRTYFYDLKVFEPLKLDCIENMGPSQYIPILFVQSSPIQY